ncbi:DUF1365 domain-containing protein [Nocardia sp. NBC_01329]|uniref:DUF1365 domain-containing protein n=1 Tax=Nocardia sp. NBC_01329 TaxID=2903594 RepID=UPI002E0DC469|nr:DUF1365 domain-containing protein [Nocardia sp. NBC_01329]
MTARLAYTTIDHVRHTPVRHRFRYRSYSWLVDLDDLPRLPRPLRPLARFRADDHLGDPDRSLRENIDTFLDAHGIELPGGRILMLTSARVLGFVFNPLTLYWCRDRTGTPVCVVAEVHNTYRGRHRYLLRTDEHDRAEIGKQFYVSPFNDVSGRYRMALPEPDDRLRLSITLHRDHPVLTASMTGECRPATTRAILAAALTMPLAPLAVAARIRVQGLRLWLRGLPVVPRTVSPIEEPSR